MLPSSALAQTAGRDWPNRARDIQGQVQESDVRATLSQILLCGSRDPGSLGVQRVRKLILGRLRDLGIKHRLKDCQPIPSLRNSLATITMGGSSTTAFALEPNGVLTNEGTFHGPAIDLGMGSWREFDGKPIRGAIAFMNWNSGDRWLRAAELGAKAIVFYGLDGWTSFQAGQKSLDIPVPVPRFYLPVPSRAIEGDCQLIGRQRWEMVRSQRIWATIEGTDPALAKQRILVMCHLDSISAVPSLSDSPEQAASVAAVWEVLKYFNAKPARRPIDFVFYDGHTIGLHGERTLASQLAQKSKAPYSLICSFDLTFSGARVGAISQGSLFAARIESREPTRRIGAAWGELNRLLGGDAIADLINEGEGRSWRASVGSTMALAAEPFILVGYPAVTLVSTDDCRNLFEAPAFVRGTPNDIGPLCRAIGTSLVMLDFAANQPLTSSSENVPAFPAPPRRPAVRSLVGGLSTLYGRALEFDPAKGFLPNVLVPEAVVSVDLGPRRLVGARAHLMDIGSKSGSFRIVGLPTATSYWHTLRQPVRTSAIWQQLGVIEKVATSSTSKTAAFERSFMLNTASKAASLTLFSPRVTTVFSLWDPLSGEALASVRTLDSKSLAEPVDYDLQVSSRGVAVAAVPVGTQSKILMGRRDGEVRAIQPDVAQGIAAFARATELAGQNLERARNLDRHRMLSPEFKNDLAAQRSGLRWAESLAGDLNWSAAQAESNRLWSMALRAYGPIKAVLDDAVLGLLVYLGLLIPFAMVVERVLLPQRRLDRRVLVASLVFAVCFLALRALHPAFKVVGHPEVVLVAFVMGVLSIGVMAHVSERFDRFMRGDAGRWLSPSGIGVAGSIAVTSLRRRPIRTLLSVAVLSVLSFSLLAFTSLSPTWMFDVRQVGPAEGPGNQVRLYRAGYAPISSGLFDAVLLATSGRAEPIAWTYADEQSNPGYFTVGGLEAPLRLSALIGVEGPRGFFALDNGAIEGQRVRIRGIDLSARTIDASAHPGLPVDYPASGLAQTKIEDIDSSRRLTRYAPEQVGVVDLETALALGGTIREVRIPCRDAQESGTLARSLARQFDLNIEDLSDGQRKRISCRLSTKVNGLPLAIMALILGGAFMLNTFASGAHERRTEIKTLSAIGMPPRQIGAMFLCEAGFMALIGIMAGYFIAQAAGALIPYVPMLEGLTLNFSSGAGILCCVFVGGLCLASGAYPAAVAMRQLGSRVPDPTPTGDELSIEAPFTFGSDEAEEVLDRLGDWISLHQRQDGTFIAADLHRHHRKLGFLATIHPYDLGISQRVEIEAVEVESLGICRLQVSITRASGDHASWVRANVGFVRSLRHELLEWRAGLARRVHSSD